MQSRFRPHILLALPSGDNYIGCRMGGREVLLMSLTCEKRCRLIKMLANFKCPGCFGIETKADEKGQCDCRLTLNSESLWLRE
jgi:hypothetical protein